MAAASTEKLCSICEGRNLTKLADAWCPECDEFLCNDCDTHHGLAKATRKHKTVDIASVHVLPEFILNIKTECEIHRQAMEYFCPAHDCSFCVKCTPNHKHCGEFTALWDMVGIKTSNSMVELEETITSLQSTFNKILESKNNNLTAMTEQHHAILKQIKEVREKINNHLDKLEKQILDNLVTEYKENKNKIEKLIQNVELHNNKLNKIKDDLDQIKMHASDMQTFFGMRKLNEEIKDGEKELEAITKGKDIAEIQISFNPYPSCLDGNMLESLGTIEVTEKQIEITLSKPKHIAAQLFVPSVNIDSIDSLRLEKIAEVDLSQSVPNAKIKGCCFTADDMILLNDKNNNQIIVLDQHGQNAKELKLEFSPYDIVFYNSFVFVSFYSFKSVQKLNISDGQKINEVTFDTRCDALAVAGDRIIVHLTDKNYTICDQSLNIVGTIPVRATFAPYLGYYDNKIFVSRWKEDTVYCYSLEGDLVWEYQDENLTSPHGITGSKYGHLFVAGRNSSNVMAISQDGTYRKELLNLKDVMTQPTAIGLNYNQNRLLITSNVSRKVIIYDLNNN